MRDAKGRGFSAGGFDLPRRIRHRRTMSKLKFAAAVALASTVFGCAGKQPESAEEYYAIANREFRDGAYTLAIENYRGLLDQYPFSELAEDAEFKIAHAYFQNQSCPEAIAGFSDFQRRHPTSPHLPLVGYLIGLCHERQMKEPNRDQSASQSAHAYYQAVTNQYPESPFADLAADRLLRTRENLAEHELNIASFYRKQGNDKAAEIRLIDLIKRYNDTDQAAEALYDLGNIYEQREEPDKAALAYAGLLYHHDDHNLAEPAGEELADLVEDPSERPAGDPVAALLARSGRFRDLDEPAIEEPEAPITTNLEAAPPPRQRGFNQPAYDPIETGRPNRRYD
jgi:outer membrane protein assembly factor BamD